MLSPRQQIAVSHRYGPMIVVAGPGSGKTRVLTERVKQLCEVTEPERICVITFARRAAEEMRDRFSLLTDPETAKRVCFGTFHSVFLSWLKKWQVLSLEAVIEDEKKTDDNTDDSRGAPTEETAAVFSCSGDGDAETQRNKSQSHVRHRKTIGFQDILNIMESVADLYAPWEDYDFFLIDEFQDIDPQQYRIVFHMTGAASGIDPNLFVVGDEDQAIYAFRGSDPSLFLRFLKDYPSAERVDLTVNYRSDPLIVSLSRKLIENNQNRFQKEITADPSRKRQSLGSPVVIKRYFDDRAEVKGIADMIGREHLFFSRCSKQESIAVLARTHRQGILIAEALEEAGIAYTSPESWRAGEFHSVLIGREMEVIRDFAVDGTENDKILEIFPVLYKAGHRKRIASGTPLIAGLLEQESLTAEERGELEELQTVLERIREWQKNDTEGTDTLQIQRTLLKWILPETGYLACAAERIRQDGGNFLDLARQIGQILFPSKHPVRLLTMHGAKGLEFDHVYVTGLTEGSCPR
ncbi:MAG: ATP-dependent helicase, partial [Erysipelotrichaceae bacterium]|nr:ATP-dependent helicase [Erysipelotrichaceae bacterium]